MDYFFVLLLTIIINIPFGYLRGDRKKFSFLWFLYIHLPVPFVMYIRKLFDVELTWTFGPIYILAYLAGQWLGQIVFRKRKKQQIPD